MPLPGYLAGKTKHELLEGIASGIEPGSILHSQYAHALWFTVAEELEQTTHALERAMVQATQEIESAGSGLRQAVTDAAAASD